MGDSDWHGWVLGCGVGLIIFGLFVVGHERGVAIKRLQAELELRPDTVYVETPQPITTEAFNLTCTFTPGE